MEIRQAINLYLTAKAYKDSEFEKKFKNENKNLDECVTFVTYMVYKKVKEQAEKGKNSMAVAVPSDDEVFAYAEQYYMDEDLKIDGTELSNVKVVSASATTFTDDEKAVMRQEAIKKFQDGVIKEQKEKNNKGKNEKAKKPSTPVLVPETTKENKTEKKAEIKQLSLF